MSERYEEYTRAFRAAIVNGEYIVGEAGCGAIMLTPSLLCREALVLFHEIRDGRRSPVIAGSRDGDMQHVDLDRVGKNGQYYYQWGLIVKLDPDALTGRRLGDFSQRYIEPAMAQLSTAIPKGEVFAEPSFDLPAGYEAAIDVYRNTEMRCALGGVPFALRYDVRTVHQHILS